MLFIDILLFSWYIVSESVSRAKSEAQRSNFKEGRKMLPRKQCFTPARVLAALMVICVAAVYIPGRAGEAHAAQTAGESASFGVNGEFMVESTGALEGVSCRESVLTVANTDDVITISGAGGEPVPGNILLSPGDDGAVRVVLKGVSLKSAMAGAGAMELGSGKAEVLLGGENTLIGENGNAAFQTRLGTELTIRGAGSLLAQATGQGAGIGAGSVSDAGDIVIEGGDVRAKSGSGGAAIGAGFSASSGEIRIAGGRVEAEGGAYGAGIGGGYKAPSGNITITGGEITATATGHYSAGIGGGMSGSASGNITITGGTVSARAGVYGGAGIGGGMSDSPSGKILITGGNVTATGYENASVGNGEASDAEEVVITGGNVEAKTISPSPVNGAGEAVYENELSFTRDVAGLPVTSGYVDEIPCYEKEPRDGAFGIKDVLVGGDGKARLYLPAAKGGAAGVGLTVGGDLFGANYARAGACSQTLRLIPDVTAPGPFGAVYGQTLSRISLPDGWTFTEDARTQVGPAGETGHPALFTPEDEAYAPVIKTVVLNVAKKDPAEAAHGDVSAVYGQTLGEVDLSPGWSWDEGKDAPVGDAGERIHTATFTHGDAANHNTQRQEIPVTVAKADPESDPPPAISTVTGKNLGDLALPEGWTFDEGRDASVGAEGAGERAVTYTPKDTANYNVLRSSVLVIVNRDEENGRAPAVNVKTIRLCGAGKVTLRTVEIGNGIGRLPKPGRKGYVFKGWYTKKNGGEKVSAGYRVTEKTPSALWARWEKEAVYGKVTGCAVLRIRQHPAMRGASSSVAGYAKAGQEIRILGREGGWYKVSTGRIRGYAWGRYIKIAR
jgi:uncharacterized repeat protein (TIGR02543 family)